MQQMEPPWDLAQQADATASTQALAFEDLVTDQREPPYSAPYLIVGTAMRRRS